MLNQETVAAIKALKQQGKSIQGMTKELGLSRNTVKKYLPHKDCAPQYQRVGSKPGKPDPFKDYIRSRIEAAAPGRIPAAVPYREILETGFQGKGCDRTCSNRQRGGIGYYTSRQERQGWAETISGCSKGY